MAYLQFQHLDDTFLLAKKTHPKHCKQKFPTEIFHFKLLLFFIKFNFLVYFNAYFNKSNSMS